MTLTRPVKIAAGVGVSAILGALAAALGGGSVDCSAHGRFERASENAAAAITCPDAACVAAVERMYLKTLELCK